MTHDEYDAIDDILSGAPESWDCDEAAESIAVDYVRELERRVLASGGTLERWGCDECDTEPGQQHRPTCPQVTTTRTTTSPTPGDAGRTTGRTGNA